MTETPVKQRLRIRFGKVGSLRYTGNLDLAKVWERTLRRANLPILYTQGFNTRPRISLPVPLPLGMTSECEIIDIAMRETVELSGLLDQIQAVSPSGLQLLDVEEVPVNAPNIQSLVRSAHYRITFLDPVDWEGLQRRIDDLLAEKRLIREREVKGKRRSVLDARPLIYSLKRDGDDLIAHLATGEYGNLRAEEILEMLSVTTYASIHRFRIEFVT